MVKYDLNDTIAAIATAIGESGIGIVRISGKDALKVADGIFLSKGGLKPSTFKTYTTHYGWIIEAQNAKRKTQNPKIIDEVILTVMRSPKSYTKEDVVEINCHGGIVALRAVLDLVLEKGCRLAQPGEFTKRAFLNGRIDLTQAEAVLDIIKSKTDFALKVGVEQLKGFLSRKINNLRNGLLDMLSEVEASIDFPDEEIAPINPNAFSLKLNNINGELKSILNTSKFGKIIREGISAVICGKPNVGKSSLLNTLLKQERSIVTPVAGTTRDTIEEIINIKGIPIRVVDTAGIIKPRDLIEKKAVWRSKRYIGLADLVILLFDGSKRISHEDRLLIRELKGKTVIAVINKIDLRQRIEKRDILRKFQHVIHISAKKLKNIDLLENAIADLVYNGKVSALEPIMLSNFRHIEALKKAQKLIAEAADSLDNKLPLELIAQNIKDALLHLDELLGKRFSQDLLDKIFSEFCIGK